MTTYEWKLMTYISTHQLVSSYTTTIKWDTWMHATDLIMKFRNLFAKIYQKVHSVKGCIILKCTFMQN